MFPTFLLQGGGRLHVSSLVGYCSFIADHSRGHAKNGNPSAVIGCSLLCGTWFNPERVSPKLTFTTPLLLATAPGINRFFVCEQAGKMYSFPIDPNVAKADLVIDLRKDIQSFDKATVQGVDELYGLAFHPQFTK